MRNNRKAIREQAKRMIGQPVCIELTNGSYYVGRIMGIENGQLILSGKKGRGKLRRTSLQRTSKARVSGLFDGLGALMGNPGGAGAPIAGAAAAQGGTGGLFGGLGGIGEFMGFINKAMPMIRMGMGVVKAIMPLLGGLKA
ncbi:hypothetical protein [Cohnella cholangitidis]|uniref:Uncharacterized protein n=1 Tax=Cohnella cholangitidis TaxID=2598458 RepID=A0A7G5BSD4_9BACL|nr:hypothetical protein [Cohnella cholangitidis]QMV39868.1 hypothetical protein FPL14_00590 [Cohnella cholangitidis]